MARKQLCSEIYRTAIFKTSLNVISEHFEIHPKFDIQNINKDVKFYAKLYDSNIHQTTLFFQRTPLVAPSALLL